MQADAADIGPLGEGGGGGEPFGDGGLTFAKGFGLLLLRARRKGLHQLVVHGTELFSDEFIRWVIPYKRAQRFYSLSARQDEYCRGIGHIWNEISIDQFPCSTWLPVAIPRANAILRV